MSKTAQRPIDLIKQAMDKAPACDFCCATPAGLWYFPTKAFQIVGIDADGQRGRIDIERGDWAACDACASLIQRNDLDRLIQRGLKQCPDVSLVRTLYQGVLDHRRGTPRYSEVRLDPRRKD